MKKKQSIDLEKVKAMVKNPKKSVMKAREEMEKNYKDAETRK